MSFKGPFGAYDKETGYDKTILSCFNPLFGASIGKDKLNLFLILSYPPFAILILGFCWVSNLIAQNYHTRILFPQSTSFDSHVSSVFSFFHFFLVLSPINWNGTETPTFLQFFLFFHLFCSLPNQLKWNGINCNFPIDCNGMEELIN